MKLNSGRKQAQRLFKALICHICGGEQTLHRHHLDHNPLNNNPMNIQILCVQCHNREHRKLKPVPCQICKKEFQPKRARNSKVCSSLCLKEMGRLSAMKRWSSQGSELKSLQELTV